MQTDKGARQNENDTRKRRMGPRHIDGDKVGLRQGCLEEKTNDAKAKSDGTKWKETIAND
jgi:hypothetical protein